MEVQDFLRIKSTKLKVMKLKLLGNYGGLHYNIPWIFGKGIQDIKKACFHYMNYFTISDELTQELKSEKDFFPSIK